MTENKYSWLERELITYGQILQRTSPENTQKVKDTFKYTTQAIIAKIEAEKAEADKLSRIDELKQPREYHIDVNNSDDFKAGFHHALEQEAEADKRRIKELKEEA